VKTCRHLARLAQLIADTIRALRLLWPVHTRKQVARWFEVSIETAKDWLTRGVPARRRIELAYAIEAEIPRLEREIQTLQRIDRELRSPANG
jgi:hypothetical protein